MISWMVSEVCEEMRRERDSGGGWLFCRRKEYSGDNSPTCKINFYQVRHDSALKNFALHQSSA